MEQQPSLILDYASPRGRSKIALPTNSVLTLHADDTCVFVTEQLKFKDGAIGAIVFATIILAGLAFVLLTTRNVAIVLVPFWLVEFSLLLKVTHDTFHKTKLEAYPDRLTLELHSPFRDRNYSWPAARVTSVIARPARSANDLERTLATLIIQIADGPTVHLFNGHPHRNLADLTNHLSRVLFPNPRSEPLGIP